MLKTSAFWKTFFTAFLALVPVIAALIQAAIFFDDSRQQSLASNWWLFYILLPLGIAFLIAILQNLWTETSAESLDQRNRRVMLDHVENFWVKGVLEKSLHGVALLELGIKENPNAVNYPWGIKKASTNENLPAGKPMLEIFQEIGLGRSLLILGAPGSGKTTMLLELTRQLIETARNDETEPIPVVFNLSSWAEKITLADWLVEQLNTFYYVPKKTAQKLVIENNMFLLLDGLDEVKEDLRGKCVNAINEFKNEHGLTSLVICSRIEEYQSIQTKLTLTGAITIQPLTSKQVDKYFDKFGKSLSSLKQILNKDKILRELTETPLMLSIMVLAYKDVNIKEIPELKNNNEQRKHLFDTYIKRMFERRTRSEKKDFSKEETRHYLSWLAYQMVEHNLINYQIEGMQPSWLENKQQRLYKWIVRLIAGLIIGLVGGLFGGLILVRLIFKASIGMSMGQSGDIIMILLRWTWWEKTRGGLIIGLIIGLISGLFGGLYARLIDWAGYEKIEMKDKLSWSWKKAQHGLISGLISGLITGLFVELIMGLIIGLSAGLMFALSYALSYALSTALIIVPFVVLAFVLSNVQIDETKYPGQRLQQSLFNYFFITILFTLIIGLILGLILGLNGRLFFGLILGMLIGLFFGGVALIQHYTLRFLLIKNKVLPKRIIPFLDYCVDLIFLRRVGGSYIFVHRLLMEHFAEMYVEKENK